VKKKSATTAEPEKKATGRPLIPYDSAVGDAICELLSTTDMGLEEVLEKVKGEFERVPSLGTIWRWLEREESFARMYARARELQATVIFDRAGRIARTANIAQTKKVGTRNGKKFVELSEGDNVQRSALDVQTSLKRAGSLNPKKYSEKLLNSGDGDAPVKIQIELVGAAPKRAPKPPPEFCLTPEIRQLPSGD
jgi:hypothetical protein